MKKVCIMTSVHPHDDIRIFHRQAKALRDAGYRVVLLCTDYEGVKDGIGFIKLRLPQDRFRRMRRASRVFYAAALKTGADLFHFHDPELLPAGRRLAQRGFPVIYDIHEDLPLSLQAKPWLPKLLRKPAATAISWVEKKFVRDITLCVAATDEIAGRFPNAVTVCNYPDHREFTKEHLPFERCQPQVVYVGGVTPSRGIYTMIDAIARTNANLVLAGRFDDQNVFEKVKRFSCNGQVHYMGVLGRAEVGQLLAESMAGLLLLNPTPAYQRALPVKLFEYMMAGLPVIASDFPLWRSLAGEECAIYVNPEDVSQIAQAIETLTSNPQRAAKMGQAGRKRALEHFRYETQAQILLNSYQSLLGAAPSS